MAKAKTKAKTSTRRRPVPSDEQRVDLNLLPTTATGGRAICRGNGEALPKVSVGRTTSKRGLRFEVVMQPGAEPISFVLDRMQVDSLHACLKLQLPRILDD